jgi:hypothetical protein
MLAVDTKTPCTANGTAPRRAAILAANSKEPLLGCKIE